MAAMSELLVVEQRRGRGERSPWVRERGLTMRGLESDCRIAELRDGLVRQQGVRTVGTEATDAEVERALLALHEPAYLTALRELDSDEPIVLAELAPPGLKPDMAVYAGLVAAAHEGVRTAIAAAGHTLVGERFTYALCRPPGHHAGPRWLAGYCLLNNAAAAVHTLREGGVERIGVLDLDLHYPNGTSAILAPMPEVHLHSLHAWPVTNLASQTAMPTGAREHAVEFDEPPEPEAYLEHVAASIEALARSCSVLVLSLGYDTVAGDPHGSWDFAPVMFAEIGRLLAGFDLPVCVVQEGGYALDVLADCSSAFAAGLLAGDRALSESVR
jgi:acetoin utilization deacetylase AcuC-like enzyme